MYSAPPGLDQVRLLEVNLHQDGPIVSMRIDLNEFPDPAPKKWVANGFNRAQITLLFIKVLTLRISGWSASNIVDVNITNRSGGVSVSICGQGTEIEGMFSCVEIEKISAYLDSSLL
jgi:hypothetical protein